MQTEDMPFIDYMNCVDDMLQEKYCISSHDAGLTAEESAQAQDDGWTPEQQVDWFAQKYNLTPRTSWTLEQATQFMQRYTQGVTGS